MLRRDDAIREYFSLNGTGSNQLIETDDMNLLDLSSSEDESGDGNQWGKAADDS